MDEQMIEWTSYDDDFRTWTVPRHKPGTLRFQLRGGRGGSNDFSGSSPDVFGGDAGRIAGYLDLPAGTTLYLLVADGALDSDPGTNRTAGYGPYLGGEGGDGAGAGGTASGCGGGGSTEIRTSTSTADRVAVAGGGGGAGGKNALNSSSSNGGRAGLGTDSGVNGQSGAGATGGGGGTLSAAGGATAPGVAGSAGTGGDGGAGTARGGGGGGGGYFGGGGGSGGATSQGGGGGGGSSWADTSVVSGIATFLDAGIGAGDDGIGRITIWWEPAAGGMYTDGAVHLS